MDLKSLLPKKSEKDIYWSLDIEPGIIQAGLWEIIEEKVLVIDSSPALAWQTDKELVDGVDTALSSIAQKLPPEAGEPSKAVFGVPSAWVVDGQISPTYLEKIKRVCFELSLSPSGFVVLGEAVAHYVKSQEGTPLNGIVLGLGAESVELSVFKLGNLVGTVTAARSVSLADDCIEALTKFGSNDALPSRIIIYNGKEGELEEGKQSLMEVVWDTHENIKFLHTPKIETISPVQKVAAICLAGGSEMAKVSSVTTSQEEQEKAASEVKKEVVGQTEEIDEEPNVQPPQISIDSLGFSLGKDVTEPAPEVVGQVQTQILPTELPVVPRNPLGNVTSVAAKLKSIPLPKFNFNFNFGKRRPIYLLLVVVPLILLAVAWWIFPKATVTVYVSPQKLNDSVDFSVVAGTQGDSATRSVSGEILSVVVSGERTKSTTGTKTVGEKAKGSVQIRNGTASVIKLPAGSVLVAGNELEFVTTEVASISAAVSPASPGTANVAVAASAIGSEYNLAKDEVFKVTNYPKSDVDAVSLSDFSGGTSRQISAVSSEDQEELENQLSEELTTKAKEELKSRIGSDKYFIDESLSFSPTSRTFSNKVGDEATNLVLSLEMEAGGIVVNESALIDLARGTIGAKIPKGFSLPDEQISLSYSFKEKSKDGQVFSFTQNISANLLPAVVPSTIAAALAGKYPADAKDILYNLVPGFTRAQVDSSPALPGKLGTLPHLKKNITIDIAVER